MIELEKEEPSEKQIDKLVLQASVLFIQHDDFDPERSALLYYIGLIGYHIGWGRWRGPGEYTNIMAALQWIIRIFILESSLPFEERDAWRTLHRDNPLIHFKQSHIYLVEGQPYPYDEIHKLLNYGMKSSLNGASRSRMSWSPDGKFLLFNGRPLQMSRWKQFVQEIIGEAEERLSKQLFRRDGKLPPINLHAWNDDQCNSEPGHYFALEDPDAPKKSQKQMMKALSQSSKRRYMLDQTPDSLPL